MLGALEAAATLAGGRIRELTLAGDDHTVETIEEIGESLRGEAPTRRSGARAARGALAPGRYLLGVRDLAAVIERSS